MSLLRDKPTSEEGPSALSVNSQSKLKFAILNPESHFQASPWSLSWLLARLEEEGGLSQKSQATREVTGPQAIFQCQSLSHVTRNYLVPFSNSLFCICKNPSHSSAVPVEKQAQDRYRLVKEKEYQKSLKHRKRCSITFTVIKMQIKSTRR